MRFIRRVLKVLLVVAVVFTAWSLFRMDTPATAFRREIVVNVPRELAWDHFSRPREWRSWLGDSGAPSDFGPGDVIGPDSVASFAGAITFRMAEFDPPNHWMWSGKMLWLTLDYDHVFEPIGDRQTRMVFHQELTGFGNDLVAWLLGAGTAAGGHPEALGRLADEINRLPATQAPAAR